MDQILRHRYMSEIFKKYHIWMYVFDKNRCLQDYIGPLEEKYSNIFLNSELLSSFYERVKKNQSPFLYIDADRFLYGVYVNTDGTLFLCGPASVTKEKWGQNYDFFKLYGVNSEDTDIPYSSYGEMANLLSILYMGIENEVMPDVGKIELSKDPLIVSEESKLIYNYEQSFEEKQRYGMQMEEKFCNMIENGDLEEFELYNNSVEIDAIEKMGDFAKSSKKKLEYMFVTSLTLARTAAVRGGISYLESCDLSDLYLQRLERCKTNMEILALLNKMERAYVKCVYEQKNGEQRNYYVESCKNMICRGITKPFDRSAIAEKIGLNPNYLSTLFKENTGMSLMRYHQKTRLQAAANLLKYSDYSIADISQRFCFASSSSFGKLFRQEFGITPLQYRHQNTKEDYIG